MARKLDPVFFDASSCSQTSRPTVTMSVPIVKEAKPASQDEANSLWLQLTKRQLACLELKLTQMTARTIEPLIFTLDDASCPVRVQ